MRKVTTILFILFCLTIVNYGQKRPITPVGQAARIARDLAWEAAKRDFYERKRQIDMDRIRQYNERQRYGVALRLEQQARYRAEYAERYYPNTPLARNLRQAATQASVYRARQQLVGQLRTDNSIRKSGVVTVPTRQQFFSQRTIRQGNNRQQVTGGGLKNFPRLIPKRDNSRDTVRPDGKINRVAIKQSPREITKSRDTVNSGGGGGLKNFPRETRERDNSRDTLRSDGKYDRVGVKSAPKN